MVRNALDGRRMSTIVVGEFEWDSVKELANIRKHGVTFTEASRAFLDPLGQDFPDETHTDRWILLGMTMPERLLYVVYADRLPSGRIRIISARKATAHEKEAYERG
jgi:uncharacterized protein